MTCFATLDEAAAAARACTLCAPHLPLGPRPTFRVSTTARLLVIGQAPGTKVHATGIPWNDPSGDRLRAWLAMTRDDFYDATRIAIVPAGFCYPGRLPAGGDAPPRPECAPRWHPVLLPLLPAVRLTLLVGGHAQALYFSRGSVTATVAAWREALAERKLPLPHPSWRTMAWERKHRWFGNEVVPALRDAVAEALH
jgi:uracil-DNA glycosylase